MSVFPDWTEYDSDESEHRGLDPLGLANIGTNIVQRRLLPGITNTTRHVRYYSFFCWVFWVFWKHRNKKTPLEQKRWRARMEQIWRAATLEQSPSITGLIGVRGAVTIQGLASDEEVRIDGEDAATAFSPANYSASFQALGCGTWTNENGAKLTERGKALALAFEQGVQDLDRADELMVPLFSARRMVPVKSVRAVGTAFCMRSVRRKEQEHPLLIDLLMRLAPSEDGATSTHQIRSRSLALLLEVAEQAEDTLTSSTQLHQIIATESLPNGRRYTPSAQWSGDFQIWKRYQERQYIKFAMYALWHEVVTLLGYRASKTASTGEILGHCRNSLRESVWAKEVLGEDCCRSTVGTLLERMSNLITVDKEEFGRSAMKMMEVLEDVKRSSPDRIGAVLTMLVLCSAYWIQTKGVMAYAEIHRAGSKRELAMASVSDDLVSMRSAPADEYLCWIVETCVLKQATLVAAEKLPDFRFFVARDEDGYRLTASREPSAYLAYDPNRIEAAYQLMAELGLLNKDNSIVLTQLGHSTLTRLRAHHEELMSSTDAWKG